MREYDPQFEDGAAVCLYALSEESLGTLIDPSAVDAAAWQAFSNGEGVIMSFPVGTDGGVFFNREHFGAADLSAVMKFQSAATVQNSFGRKMYAG